MDLKTYMLPKGHSAGVRTHTQTEGLEKNALCEETKRKLGSSALTKIFIRNKGNAFFNKLEQLFPKFIWNDKRRQIATEQYFQQV